MVQVAAIVVVVVVVVVVATNQNPKQDYAKKWQNSFLFENDFCG